MVNYANGKIYKVEAMNAPPDEKVYVGSTTKQYLSQRMNAHRSAYKKWKETDKNKVMSYELFDKYGIENCTIVLLENINANSKDELLARENFYFKSLDCFNKNIPKATEEDKQRWKLNYRPIYEEKQKKYKENHKKETYEYNKKYYNQLKCFLEKISETHFLKIKNVLKNDK
jgi:ribosome-interacting GTPase 1